MVALPFPKNKPERPADILPEVEKPKETFPLPERPDLTTQNKTEKIIKPSSISYSSNIRQVTDAKDETLQKIEHILGDDLEETYHNLPPNIQKKFKQEGEKAALAINVLLNQVKIKTGKIFKIIFNWLKIIPGASKFFLKQEAKIKTDQILKLKK